MLCGDGEQPRPTGYPRRTRCRPHGRLQSEARCPASIRSQAAASAPNRPPTSTPTTTADSAHELGGSGGVCVGRRHRQLDRWGCTSAPGWAVTGLMMVASTACCAPCHKARSRQFRCGGHRRSMFMSARRTLRATRAPASWHTLATAREGLGMRAHRKSHMLPCGRRVGQGDPGRRTCAVRLAATNGAVVAATRGRVVLAPSTQLRLGSL